MLFFSPIALLLALFAVYRSRPSSLGLKMRLKILLLAQVASLRLPRAPFNLKLSVMTFDFAMDVRFSTGLQWIFGRFSNSVHLHFTLPANSLMTSKFRHCKMDGVIPSDKIKLASRIPVASIFLCSASFSVCCKINSILCASCSASNLSSIARYNPLGRLILLRRTASI